MAKLEIFDKPMCCSTGICGPEVDPILPRFAADLNWLKTNGHVIERYNLAHQPAAFAENAVVQNALANEGVDCLPLIIVEGQVVSRASYPSREQLTALADGQTMDQTRNNPMALPIAGSPSRCCGNNTEGNNEVS